MHHYGSAISFNSLMFELHCKLINQWMLDSVQHLALPFRIRTGKYMLCHPRSIELTSIGQSIGAETFRYTLKANAAWFHHLTRKQIIIDKYCTKLTQLCRYRAFASRYAAGQSYSNHHNRHCNALACTLAIHIRKDPEPESGTGSFLESSLSGIGF